jgi:hypothetical protein
MCGPRVRGPAEGGRWAGAWSGGMVRVGPPGPRARGGQVGQPGREGRDGPFLVFSFLFLYLLFFPILSTISN